MDTFKLTVEIPEFLQKNLNNYVELTKVSTSDIVVDALAHYLDCIEDLSLSQKVAELAIKQLMLPTPTTLSEVELNSEKGIDYTDLRALLTLGQWKQANEETVRVLLQTVDRDKDGWLTFDDIKQIPCAELEIIDRLWVNYSNGRFGFSVQHQIWLELGGKVSYEIERCLGDLVGWRQNGKWLPYKHLTFDLDALPGHLPAWWWCDFAGGCVNCASWCIVSSLMDRVQTCQSK